MRGSARTRIGVLVLALGVTAGCDHPDLAARSGGRDGGHVVTGGRGDLKSAGFELASGATTVVLGSGDIGGALYRVTTPPGAGVLPTAALAGGQVVVQLRSSGTAGPSIVEVTLSSAIVWTVRLDGGATEATVDMRAGGLAVLDFGAGVSRIDATVPRPGGTAVVRMAGGASEFTLHAPAGVPTRVTLGGGCGTATIDGTAHTGVAGGTVYAPSGWDSAASRVDVDNTAGVSTFTLLRY